MPIKPKPKKPATYRSGPKKGLPIYCECGGKMAYNFAFSRVFSTCLTCTPVEAVITKLNINRCFMERTFAVELIVEGKFSGFSQWVNKAASWLDRDAICIDQKGRRCRTGADFERARDEGTFPVIFGWDFKING